MECRAKAFPGRRNGGRSQHLRGVREIGCEGGGSHAVPKKKKKKKKRPSLRDTFPPLRGVRDQPGEGVKKKKKKKNSGGGTEVSRLEKPPAAALAPAQSSQPNGTSTMANGISAAMSVMIAAKPPTMMPRKFAKACRSGSNVSLPTGRGAER